VKVLGRFMFELWLNTVTYGEFPAIKIVDNFMAEQLKIENRTIDA
jgi:hypothetical protein